jgi:hypothetical protein
MSRCATCNLPSSICAIAAKVTHGCKLAAASRWERRGIPGYVVTLDLVTSTWTEETGAKPEWAYRWVSVSLRDEADTSWSLWLPQFFKRYEPTGTWAERVLMTVPPIPKEYRR